MQLVNRAALALLLALPATALPSSAQNYHWDFNVNFGHSWLGKILDLNDFDFADFDEDIGAFDDDFEDINLGNNWLGGAQLGYWFTRTVGLRANVAYTESSLNQRRLDLFNSVNLWSFTGDLLVRLNKPEERWRGLEWLPYLAFGLGAQWINPAGDRFFLVNDINVLDFDDNDDGIIDIEVQGHSGVAIVCTFGLCHVPRNVGGLFPIGTRAFFLEEESTLTGLLGIGLDVRFAPRFALRLEFGDRIWEAPMREALTREGVDFVLEDFADAGEVVNQFYLTAGASYLFGLESPPRQVVAMPAPRPAPPPPPAPTTEEITVCVLDPTFASGLRNISARRSLTSGDTTIARNGDRVELSAAVGNIPVAANASWYLSGAPFAIGVAPRHMQYAVTGAPRAIEPSMLVFLGTVNGLAVFADRQTLGPALSNLGPNTDLNRLVLASEAARLALDAVPILYVPLQATGCVFLALQKQVEVRKR